MSEERSNKPMAPDPVVVVEDLHVSFGDHEVLRGVELTLGRGEVVVILGGSGCGKSTLLRAIIGSVTPSRGEVRVFGQTLSSLSGDRLDEVRKKVGILFQSGALFQSMTTGENIAFVLREHTTLTEEEITILVRMKLEMVGLRHAEDLLPSEISGGMKKRVALARALALDPVIMLYDEPGAGLDPVTLAGVDRLITVLGRVLNMSSMVVTHRIQSAMRIANKMIFLHEGEVLFQGTPEEIREFENPVVRQFLAGDAADPLGSGEVDEDYTRALLGLEMNR